MKAYDLFELADEPRFDGADYDHQRDGARLQRAQVKVYDLMKDGNWRTLRMISQATKRPEASVSACLRDFRKERFGGHTVEREYIENGLYKYRLLVRKAA